VYNDIILNSKEGHKKIIKPFYSIIKDVENDNFEVLILGEDVTFDGDHHGKILRRSSYLIPEKSNESALDLFMGLVNFDNTGLFITRANPEWLKSNVPDKNIKIELLSQDKIAGFDNIPDIEVLISKINKFCMKHECAVILLDRIDYLISTFSFEKFIKSLYLINNIIIQSDSILLLHLNPSIIDDKQFALIEEELMCLPSQKIEHIQIDDELFRVLKYVLQQNQQNTLLTFSQIGRQFSIVRETVRKRLKTLENKGLISINKQGRNKTLYVSEKGKTLLNKRSIN